MKNLVLLLLLQAAFLNAQDNSNFITDSKGREVLWGDFETADLQKPAFADWFKKGYDNYVPDAQTTKALKTSLADYQLKVFMGTWCGDSKREIPKLIKLLSELNFPAESLQLIALRGDGDYYKQAPNGETKGLNIHRVPTIIVYKNGQEVNRIVEEPITSLEEDLLAINKDSYRPNYPLANSLGKALDNDLHATPSGSELKKLANMWKGKITNYYELNTLAYVLQTQGRDKQALCALRLNCMLFEQEAQLHYRLGKQLEDLQMFKDAALSYAKAAELKPNIKDYRLALERVKAQESGK